MSYEEYAQKALEELKSVQETFGNLYPINRYANWFYNQTTGLLRFYNDDMDEIYFEYLPIGTYSTKTQTWMWEWNKETSLEKNKNQALTIREFGKQNNYEKLINPHFDSDIYDGSEFLAIAYKLLGGIGVYKPITDYLELYFLLLEKVPSEEARAREKDLIECEEHGKGRITYICQHLLNKTNTGFEEAFETNIGMELDEEEDFQAWCDECEKVRIKSDGWTDESMKFADIKLVCESCYFEMKKSRLD